MPAFYLPGLPGGKLLSLVSPRERNQREGDPCCRGASHSPALLAKSGGCATRPNKPHKTRLVAELKQCSPKAPVLAVLLSAAEGEVVAYPRYSYCKQVKNTHIAVIITSRFPC